MNERLSRMERHSRKQQKRRAIREDDSKAAEKGLERTETLGEGLGRRRRNPRKSSMAQELPMTRDVPIPSRTSGRRSIQEPGPEEDLTVEDMPSRREMFPSHRIKWTKWFYNSLVIIFIAVTILLFFWGMQLSTWGIHRK
ncbi:hypothetical protein [Paenibacillus sp. J22TS3]|uniref:hypothetical protein n=1 Tax=Paenibacillus sp. J22TS3 TaxID=2807192 RepID=UPI001B196002|nr:hypothetical protein [Paenibacillus sp. J22TS3]GIP20141.1 hypothetical protein J22TS3_04160 [Paenibacillus sp. J22TS3]